MADKKISEATSSVPAGTDMIPLERPADTTARRATLQGVMNALAATDSTLGSIKKATTAQAQAGTADDTAVTPAGLAGTLPSVTVYTATGAAIQAAINAAPANSVIQLLDGATYVVSSTITPVSGLTFNGRGATIDSSALNGPVFDCDDLTDITLEGINFIGPSTRAGFTQSLAILCGEPAGSETGLSNANNIVIKGCSFQYYWCGGVTLDGSNCKVIDCYFDQVNYWHGVDTYRGCVFLKGNRHIVSRNHFIDYSTKAVEGQGINGCIISNNVCREKADPRVGGAYLGNNGIVILSGPWGGGSDNIIEGNHIYGCTDEGIAIQGTNHVGGDVLSRNIIRGNKIVDAYSIGIALNRLGAGVWAVDDTIVEGNQIYMTKTYPDHVVAARYGIQLSGACGTIVRGSRIYSDGAIMTDGINLSSTADYDCSRNIIEGNNIEGAAAYGVRLNNGAGSSLADIQITGNLIGSCPKAFSITGDDIGIIGNRTANSATKAIEVGSSVNRVEIYNNQFDGAASTAEDWAKVKARNNRGLVTTNSGTATVNTSSTMTVNIPHGLAATPTRIFVTPNADLGSHQYWVSYKDATNFIVTLDSENAGAAITFDWLAILGEG